MPTEWTEAEYRRRAEAAIDATESALLGRFFSRSVRDALILAIGIQLATARSDTLAEFAAPSPDIAGVQRAAADLAGSDEP